MRIVTCDLFYILIISYAENPQAIQIIIKNNKSLLVTYKYSVLTFEKYYVFLWMYTAGWKTEKTFKIEDFAVLNKNLKVL